MLFSDHYMECMLQRVCKGIMSSPSQINVGDRPRRMSCLPRRFAEEFCQLREKKMEKVERKRKTDRDLYVVEVVEVDTTRKQLKIHFLGFSHEYQGRI